MKSTWKFFCSIWWCFACKLVIILFTTHTKSLHFFFLFLRCLLRILCQSCFTTVAYEEWQKNHMRCSCVLVPVMRILQTPMTHIVPIFSIYCVFFFSSLFSLSYDLFFMFSSFLHHIRMQHLQFYKLFSYSFRSLCINGNLISFLRFFLQ